MKAKVIKKVKAKVLAKKIRRLVLDSSKIHSF